MAARLLCIGDMHLGRRPSRIPADLAEFDLALSDLTPAAAWRRAVRAAIEHRVDGVVLLGDVVEDRYFEAFGHLERGVTELARAGIGVVAIAGNHDVDALPRLANEIRGFDLLGRDGRWEVRSLKRDGKPLIRLCGWSFPREHFAESPLSTPPRVVPSDVPTLGLLHCDLDQAASPYAPVAREDLLRVPVNGWLLGHIHKPESSFGERPLGYLGSLQGLDCSETGRHGPWLLRADAEGIELEQLSLAGLRWERVDVELDPESPEKEDDLGARVAAALRALHDELRDDLGTTLAVGCRVHFSGRTSQVRELRRQIAEGELTRLRRIQDGVLYFVEGVEDTLRGAYDLRDIARGDDPMGLLARELLILETQPDGEEARERLVGARRELERAANLAAFGALEQPDLDDDVVRGLLLHAGSRALEELVDQRGRS